MKPGEQEMARLQAALDRNREGMEGCSHFASIWSPETAHEVIPTMQWGLAVLLDKPIYLIVPNGPDVEIPENVRRLARGTLAVNMDDAEGARIAARWLKEQVAAKPEGGT